MKPGQASRTAVMVCMGRAIANGRIEDFQDPTALVLLPDDAKPRVEAVRIGAAAQTIRERAQRAYLVRQSQLMVVRTTAIDNAVREAAHEQIVILGAGLDGRAWRLDALHDAVVFEVDHPDSQADKRKRVSGLEQRAREVRFVAVDFTRDDLDAALTAAGHDPSKPTTWIWEGVVMYLAQPDIEKTLEILQRRSATKSRLIVLYHTPALILRLVGFVVSRLGEPLKSKFKREQMRALLGRYRFGVVEDTDMATLGARTSAALHAATKPISHLRLAVADFA